MAGKKAATENTKKASGNAKKAEAAAAKQAQENAKKAQEEDQDWGKGAKSNAKKYVLFSMSLKCFFPVVFKLGKGALDYPAHPTTPHLISKVRAD